MAGRWVLCAVACCQPALQRNASASFFRGTDRLLSITRRFVELPFEWFKPVFHFVARLFWIFVFPYYLTMRGRLRAGITMFEPLHKTLGTIAESPWLLAPVAAVLVFAGVLYFLLRHPNDGVRRRGLLFGVGSVAILASVVFVTFVWSFVRLLTRDSWSFDVVWIMSALGTGAFAIWLWSRFYRIARSTWRDFLSKIPDLKRW